MAPKTAMELIEELDGELVEQGACELELMGILLEDDTLEHKYHSIREVLRRYSLDY